MSVNIDMKAALEPILAKHNVGLFELVKTDYDEYTINTDVPLSPACYSELVRQASPYELRNGALPKSVQPLLPGMGPSPVNHPAHYNAGKFEVIEVIEDWGLSKNYHRGNAIKYVARAGKKDPTKEIEDLEKAVWYLKREIELLKAAKAGTEPRRPNDMNPRCISATGVSNSSHDEQSKAFAPSVPMSEGVE